MPAAQLCGVYGEVMTCHILDGLAKEQPTLYIRNFPIETPNGYKQIDCVLLTLSGVFCIEIKNWTGTVECSKDSKYWNTSYSGKELVVPSPYIQNKRHCSLLSKAVGFKVHNLIVFSDAANLSSKLSETVYMSELKSAILSKPNELTENTIKAVYERLLKYKRKNEINMLVNFFMKQIGD